MVADDHYQGRESLDVRRPAAAAWLAAAIDATANDFPVSHMPPILVQVPAVVA